jgi:hypothetical protein
VTSTAQGFGIQAVIYPDWRSAVRDIDAVHMTLRAITAIQGLRFPVDSGVGRGLVLGCRVHLLATVVLHRVELIYTIENWISPKSAPAWAVDAARPGVVTFACRHPNRLLAIMPRAGPAVCRLSTLVAG